MKIPLHLAPLLTRVQMARDKLKKVQLIFEESDLASLVSIKGKYLLGHRQWERV